MVQRRIRLERDRDALRRDDVTLTTPSNRVAAAYVRANDKYRATGSLVLTHDVGKPRRWKKLTLTATTPARTRISVRTRSSNDRVEWSAWRGAVAALPIGRYVQIQVDLLPLIPAAPRSSTSSCCTDTSSRSRSVQRALSSSSHRSSAGG